MIAIMFITSFGPDDTNNPCQRCNHLMLVENDSSELGEAFCNHPVLDKPMFLCYASILSTVPNGYVLRFWDKEPTCPMKKW